jgi:hypothetical protein
MRHSLLALVVLVLGATARADEWSPPEKLKINWPASFAVSDLAVNRVQEASSFICVRGKKERKNYIYAAKGTPLGINTEKAGETAKRNGKFDVISTKPDEAVLKRGGSIAWISFSHRALPTTVVIKNKKPASEMYFEIDVPPTTIVTEDDWMKICEEASEIFTAAAKK